MKEELRNERLEQVEIVEKVNCGIQCELEMDEFKRILMEVHYPDMIEEVKKKLEEEVDLINADVGVHSRLELGNEKVQRE